MKRFTVGSAAVALLLVTGCADVNQPLSPLFGEATKANFEAMVDDPRPVEGDPVPDAGVIDAAIDRYRQDQVKRPGEGDNSGMTSVSNR